VYVLGRVPSGGSYLRIDLGLLACCVELVLDSGIGQVAGLNMVVLFGPGAYTVETALQILVSPINFKLRILEGKSDRIGYQKMQNLAAKNGFTFYSLYSI
jgi:hypothetical protein